MRRGQEDTIKDKKESIKWFSYSENSSFHSLRLALSTSTHLQPQAVDGHLGHSLERMKPTPRKTELSCTERVDNLIKPWIYLCLKLEKQRNLPII